MKIKIVLAVISIFIITDSFSQAYVPFVKEGKEWSELIVNAFNPNNKSIADYRMQGDTVIGIKNYKKLYVVYLPSLFTEINYLFEDTNSKRVFFYDTFTHHDSLLYDFKISIGENFSSFQSCSDSVINKYTEYFAGKLRTKIVYPSSIWYEGIGNIYGVMRPISFCTTGADIYLLCYFENDSLLYHNSALSDSCFLITNINELPKEQFFNCYYSENTLYVKPATTFNYKIILYDIFGRKLIERTSSGNLELNLSFLPKGFYLYEVDSKVLISSKRNKFIIN